MIVTSQSYPGSRVVGILSKEKRLMYMLEGEGFKTSTLLMSFVAVFLLALITKKFFKSSKSNLCSFFQKYLRRVVGSTSFEKLPHLNTVFIYLLFHF